MLPLGYSTPGLPLCLSILFYFFYTLNDAAVHLFVDAIIPTHSSSRPETGFISFMIIFLAPSKDPSIKQILREFCESVNQQTDDYESTARSLGSMEIFFCLRPYENLIYHHPHSAGSTPKTGL